MTKHSAGIIKTGFLSANKIQIRKGDSLGMACCSENETQINQNIMNGSLQLFN